MVPDEDIQPGQHRLLEVDNRIVLPVDSNIRIIITAGDVLHSWAMPALGIKKDAIPGRLNETWARIDREGVYYGQCSEICGTNHGYMPIAIEAVSKERFAQWLVEAKESSRRIPIARRLPSRLRRALASRFRRQRSVGEVMKRALGWRTGRGVRRSRGQ